MEEQKENKAVEQEEPVETEAEEKKETDKDLKDQLLRALAEAENTRRRAQKECEDAKKYAITSFARELLVVADNLRRALDAIQGEKVEDLPTDLKSLVEGVEITEKELLAIFEKHKVKKISPKGKPFDHEYHHAMFEVETNEHPAGTVVEVMQDGYALEGRLLRPALVGVAKTPTELSGPKE